FFVLGAVKSLPDSQLNRSGGIYQTFFCRMVKRSSVAVGLTKVLRNGVIVGIKMYQGHRAVNTAAGSQFRQGHTVIPAYGNGNYSVGKKVLDFLLDNLKRFFHIAGHG